MSRLTQALRQLFLTATKKQGFVKGADFETYISRYIFPEDKYTLIYKTPGEEDNAERFIESSLFPDFQFEDKKTGKKFWVEKYIVL